MNPSVLFLDVDGVLTSEAWLRGRGVDCPRDDLVAQLDPAAVALLEHVVDATHCHVVLSSTWRLRYDLEAIQAALVARGFTGSIHDTTPDLKRRTESEAGLWIGATRGQEIEAWLCSHRKAHGWVPQFAIIDDDSDMAPHESRHVKTTFERGMQRFQAEVLIVMLSPPRMSVWFPRSLL